MTNTYNTGNPLGSNSLKDLSDNASNLDEGMNSSSPSFTDRFNKRRQTWAGFEADFQQLLINSGFEPVHLTYVDGSPLVVARPTQLIDRAGLSYRVKTPASFPVSLTGTWATDLSKLVEVTDTTLRDDLLAGASLLVADSAVNVDGRSLEAALNDIASVKNFGAKGDGVTDDSAAIAAAHLFSKTVLYPPGVYLCNSPITLPDRDCAMVGSGVGVSEIRFGTGVGTGISAVFSDSITAFTMKDLQVTTLKTGDINSVGMRLQWPENFEHGFTGRLFMEHCTFRGANDQANGWGTGCRIIQCDNGTFVGCTWKGQGGGSDGAPFTQAVNTVSVHGCEILGRYSPTDFHFTNCWFYCLQDGLYVGDTAEGVMLVSCTFVEVLRGVTWATGFWSDSYPVNPGGNASGRPQLVMLGCHVNCFINAVSTNGVVSIHISDCLLYHIDRATQVGNLIQVINSTECNIHDNELWSFNSAFGTNGVVFGSNVTRSFIRDNAFISGGGMTSGIVIQSGSNLNIISGNTLRGAITNQFIVDGGSANAIGARGALVSRTGAVSMPNNTLTGVPWDAVSYDSDAFWTGSGGNLVINSQSIRKIVVEAGVVFDSNATGVRQISIAKNGALTYPGQGSAAQSAVSGLTTMMSCRTAEILVQAGDILTLQVLQTSGGALNLQGSGLTWMSVKVVC